MKASIKYKYVFYLTVISLLWLLLSEYVLNLIFVEVDLKLYPLIPLYFYVITLIGYRLIYLSKSKNNVMLFMLSRMTKLLLSIIIILVCLFFIKNNILELVVAFVGNYLFYLVLDSVLMMKYQANKKVYTSKQMNNETVV